MAVNTKAIKGRIKSVGNIKKITKAMELVAAAKMRKAVDAALATRTYAELAWELLENLSKVGYTKIKLLEVRPVKKALVIIITSNRGLCGSFNSNVIKSVAKSVDKRYGKVGIDVIGIGRRGARFAKKKGYNLIATYDSLPDIPKLEDILNISKTAIDSFTDKKYDQVVVGYTNFKSSLSQEATLKQILPVSQESVEGMLETLGDTDGKKSKLEENLIKKGYKFEPHEVGVLRMILPRLVEVQLYQALLESTASEHSARMLAMKNANEAAQDMIKELQLSYNKARQAAITQEIAEIAGGAAALE